MKRLKFIIKHVNGLQVIKKITIWLVVIGAAVYGYRQAITVPWIRDAVVMATTVKPETFTELYFEDHINLPKDTLLYEEKNFKFTIHNLEYKTMTYPYEVYIDFNGEKQMIDEGSITLAQDEYKTIGETYMLTQPTKRVEVIVNLVNKHQQIDFWIGEI